MVTQTKDRTEILTETAAVFLEAAVPIVLIHEGLKAPMKRTPATEPVGAVLVLTDPYQVDIVAATDKKLGPLNIGVYVGRQKNSPLMVLDLDSRSGVEKARELGVRSDSDPCWMSRTGKGGWHIWYYAPSEDLPRVIHPEKTGLDLLVNGFAVVPPSDTSKEENGGGGYRWIDGHSPWDIPIGELSDPPEQLLDWWRGLAGRGRQQSEETDASRPGAWTFLKEGIPEGQRNDSLMRIAGWLRLYHPQHVVEQIVHCVNESRCDPPVGAQEVESVVRSAFRYAQPGVNGHPRAIVLPEINAVSSEGFGE